MNLLRPSTTSPWYHESDSPILRIGGKDESDSPNVRLVRQRRSGLSAQRFAVQRRAVESGTTLGTKSHFKIAPISWRRARPLQRRVRRLASGDCLPPACADHTSRVSHGTTSQPSVSPSAHDHAPHYGRCSESQSARDQTEHNKQSAPRAPELHHPYRAVSTTGTRTTPA
jgi:hypothetical protein